MGKSKAVSLGAKIITRVKSVPRAFCLEFTNVTSITLKMYKEGRIRSPSPRNASTQEFNRGRCFIIRKKNLLRREEWRRRSYGRPKNRHGGRKRTVHRHHRLLGPTEEPLFSRKSKYGWRSCRARAPLSTVRPINFTEERFWFLKISGFIIVSHLNSKSVW